MNVWSRLIDPGFDDMNINVIRGEGMSVASSERKNIKRKLNECKKFGKKGDGIFRLHKGRLEYGAIEAGRKWEGTNGTKYMTDSLKISKMLKDMLDKLITECNHLNHLVHELKVIGILHGANRLQVLTVDHPQGYITRIYRNKVQEVAGRLTNAKPLALVLKEILCARFIITATMNLVNKKDDLNIETFLLDDDDNDGSCTSFTNTVIKTFTTPKKLSTKDMIMKLRNNNNI